MPPALGGVAGIVVVAAGGGDERQRHDAGPDELEASSGPVLVWFLMWFLPRGWRPCCVW